MGADEEKPSVEYRRRLIAGPSCGEKNCRRRYACVINPHEGDSPKSFYPRVQQKPRGRVCFNFEEDCFA